MDYFCDQCCVKIHKTINKVDVIIINLLVSCLQHTQESFAKATTAKDILENTNVNVIGLSQSEICKKTGITSAQASRRCKKLNLDSKKNSKFNYVKFLKFCKANKLANVIKNADSFVPMLAARNIRG